MSAPTTIVDTDVKESPQIHIDGGLPLPIQQSLPPNAASHHDPNDNSCVPQLSAPRLFWFFLTNFGIFAWGGPVAQIALIKDRLVIRDKWISLPRFNRVFAVYQIVPGPEAAELCMFFGCLAGGRWGGLAAGLGFILPGFLLMLLASYLYVVVGLGNLYVDASFRALQPMVAAMVAPLVIIHSRSC
jgi:chromate transport protein ChrA